MSLLSIRKENREALFETLAALGLDKQGRDIPYRWDDYVGSDQAKNCDLIHEQAHDILLTKDVWCLHPVHAFGVLSMFVE